MVDMGHGINSIVVKEATSKITRSTSSSLEYLRLSKQNTDLEYLLRKPNTEQNSEALLSEKDKEDALKPLDFPDFIDREMLVLATLVAAVTYQAAIMIPWGGDDDEHLPAGADPMVRGGYLEPLVVAFLCFNSMAFVASLFILMLLMRRTVRCHSQGFCLWAMWLCTAAALIGLTGVFAIWSSRCLTTSICLPASVAVILLSIIHQVLAFLRKPVDNWNHNIKGVPKFSKLFDTDESEGHLDPKLSDPQETVDDEQHLQKSREYLLLLAILVATITYEVGVNPPGGLRQENANDGQHHYRAGDPVHHTTYPRRYNVFFNCNATAFMASLVIVIVLFLSNICRTLGIKYYAYARQIGAYAAGRCRMTAISTLFARGGGNKVESEAPETTLVKVVRRRLLLLAILAASVTYQAGLSPPDGFLSDSQANDEQLPGGAGGDPKLRGRHLERLVMLFLGFISSCINWMAFVASLVILMLLMARTVMCHGHGCSRAVWMCADATLIGLMGAFAIRVTRSLTISIWFSALVAAVLLCIALQFLAFLRKPVENRRDHNIQETQQETVDGDQLFLKSSSPVNLLLLGILAASITYHAGLEPPGGLWQENDTDGLHRYQAFFYFTNVAAFVASLVILILLISNICRNRGIKYCALQDLLGLIGAYSAGSCSGSADPAIRKDDDPNRPMKSNNPREATWRVACAVPHHMTGNQSLLLTGSYLPVHDDNDGGEGILVHSAAKGEMPLRVRGSGSVRTESIALDDVWYVPGLDSNLVSTGQLARQGCIVNLGPSGCRVTRGGALVGSARFTEACQFELDFLKVAASSM